jgi:plastocyanin
MRAISLLVFTAISFGASGATTYNLNWSNNGTSANQSMTIEVGDTVRWTWGAGTHNLVSISGTETFDSGYSSTPNHVFSHTFSQAGATSYQCDPHDGNMYGTVTVTSTSEPTPPTGDGDSVFKLSLGEPINGETHSGIGNLRGWAIAEKGIDRVEIFIDGKYKYDAPYGGLRVDVEAAFPNLDGALLSGYSLAFGYADLGSGEHTVRAVAFDSLGNSTEQSSTFTVVVYDENFINSNEVVDLSGSTVSASGDEITINDASIGEGNYDLKLKWRTAEQGFEVIDIR